MDTDFFEDKKVKLLKAEFGARGLVILLSTLCRIYSNNGYYTGHDKDDDLFEADKLGCGITPELVREVVQGSVKRSFFDEGVFNQFGVLTSPGIQRRFIRAVAKRDDINMISEYWLLDIDNRDDVPTGLRDRIRLKTLSGEITQIIPPETRLIPEITPKVKEKEKERERESIIAASPDIRPDFNTLEAYASGLLTNLSPTQADKLISYRNTLPDDVIRHAIDEAVNHGKYYFGSVQSILNRYVEQRLLTLDDVLKDERAYRMRKQPSKPQKPKPELKWYL